MSASEGRTWARLGRSAQVRVTSRRPGVEAETLESSVLLSWNEADPAAVALAIADPWAPGETVEWVIARNTLVAAHLPGMAETIIGLGDVRVRYSGGQTHLWFGNREGSAAVVIPSETIVALLSDAARIAPLGEAEARIYAEAIDAELAALLDGAA